MLFSSVPLRKPVKWTKLVCQFILPKGVIRIQRFNYFLNFPFTYDFSIGIIWQFEFKLFIITYSLKHIFIVISVKHIFVTQHSFGFSLTDKLVITIGMLFYTKLLKRRGYPFL